MDQRGQSVPLVALVVLAIGGLTLGLVRFGVDATHAAQAQAAADAAALAGAAEGREAAESLAAANGGAVLDYEVDGAEVEVRTRVGDLWAVARARRTGGGGPGVTGWVGQEGSGGSARTLAPEVRRRLEAAAELLHQPVPITRAAGRAVDVPGTFAPRLAAVAARVGLCRSTQQTHPVRFAPCRTSG